MVSSGSFQSNPPANLAGRRLPHRASPSPGPAARNEPRTHYIGRVSVDFDPIARPSLADPPGTAGPAVSAGPLGAKRSQKIQAGKCFRASLRGLSWAGDGGPDVPNSPDAGVLHGPGLSLRPVRAPG